MGAIVKLTIRIVVAIILSIIAYKIGVPSTTTTLSTLFTVEGIMFSTAMSMLISTSLTEVLNDKIRKPLRIGITQVRKGLIYDFSLTALIVAIALHDEKNTATLVIEGYFEFKLFATTHTILSFLYEIYNFSSIHKLSSDLEEKIIEEKKRK